MGGTVVTKQQSNFDEYYEKIKELNEDKEKESTDEQLDVNGQALDEWVEAMSQEEDDEALKLEQKLEIERDISDHPDEETLVFDEEREMNHDDQEDERAEMTREMKEDLTDEVPAEKSHNQGLVEEPIATERRRKSKTKASKKKQKSRRKEKAGAPIPANGSEKEEAPIDKVKENINYTRNFIDMTRRNRMNLSERLMRYSRRWKLVFFVINIEAVIFVLLSLTGTIENLQIGNFSISFSLLSGIFTIYVILLQYYINVLNYSERALRAHYHQLELRDLGLHLNMLLIKRETDGKNMTDKYIIEKNEEAIEKYQLALKNNENHRAIDNKLRVRGEQQRAYSEGKSKKRASFFAPLDFTLDNMLIIANAILTVIMLVIMVSVLLGVNLF